MRATTKFNPVKQAVQDSRGIALSRYRMFATALCWVCQKDKDRYSGKGTDTQPGNACAARASGAPRIFVCAECAAEKAARKAAKEAA